MKIRTRFLLFLLPTMICGMVFMALIATEAQNNLAAMGMSLIIALLVMIAMLFFIANKIARPVQKLNDAAFSIAAGQYGQNINVKGPKEIKELANTLNTMSECLEENINRLEENSLAREKLYGEYECSLLLQGHMLQKVIEDSKCDALAIKAITIFSRNPKGLLLELPMEEGANLLNIRLVEANEAGFEGIYSLLTIKNHKYNIDEVSVLSIEIDKSCNRMRYSSNSTRKPLVWSLKKEQILNDPEAQELQAGDFFFLYSEGLLSLLKTHQQIEKMVTKTMKFFAAEGLETCVHMLSRELHFTIHRQEPQEDIHLLCFQLLY